MKKSISKLVHDSAKDLEKSGFIGQKTMREFDALCLTPIEDLSPTAIKKIRRREKVSQKVFALYLNTSPSTVRKWETGEKHPSNIALKLLNLVARNGLNSIT